MRANFAAQYERGVVAERAIGRWLRRNDWNILPVYDLPIDNGRGPRVYTPQGQLIAPDMLAFSGGEVRWVEAKRKAGWSLYHKTGEWVCGIDLCHYENYCHLTDINGWMVWLLFLSEGKQTSDSDRPSPPGLWGHSLAYLRTVESHRSDRHGPSGMVYWAMDKLIKYAELEEVLEEA